ncbi:hypothetical protein [Plantactinospora sp. KLBMP9567]|uniref:hypothetical protein n=1 Tax=Plantactinospora sp. KLBMP9567 TaxID=3085900 RepID=UPI0029829D39|nr:hypothetical protein [Plantactinospora sp. KLBMP9567]MDW5330689.1 hypothetical protein [Plantactinospora sp. KLBMP9567]
MSQPQPEETAPAGRATPAGPPPAEGSATVASGDQHTRAADQQHGRTGDQQHGQAAGNEHGQAGDEHGHAGDEHGHAGDEHGHAGDEHGHAGEPDDTAVDVPVEPEPDGSGDADLDQPTLPTPPPGATVTAYPTSPADSVHTAPAPAAGDEGSPAEKPQPAAATEPAATEDSPRAAATEHAAPDGPPAADDDTPTRRTPPPDATRIDRPADDDSGSVPAEGGVPALPSEDDGPAPTRVAAPRWTGSAAVPPPRPRKRRWLLGDAEEADVPAAPTARTRPADPTLRMPEVEADEIPTPVDPWAGAADDPWDAYPPVGGHQGAASHPPVGYDAPVSPPPARQLPVTRRFPAPTGPPPPPRTTAPPPAGPRPPAPPPHAAPPPPPPPARAARPPAPPAPRKQPPPPVAPPRPAKQRRRPEAPPVRKPPPAPLPPVRRRRRWPRVMFTLTLLTIACCCGVPAYYAKPIWDQYPASPVDPLPSEVLDLQLLDNAAGRKTAEQLKREVQGRSWFTDGEAFAGVYRTSNGKQVIIFGSTGFRLSPESAVQEEVTRLQNEYGVTSVEPVPTGVRGEYRSCGTGEADGDEVVVCTWADHGSSATALFTRLSIADSSELLSTLRDSIIVRDPVGSGSGSASTG